MFFKAYRTSILLAVTFTILLSTFWYMPQLAFIIFISLLLQLLLTPLVDKLSEKMSRGLASAIVLVDALILLLILLTLVSSSLVPTFTTFITDFPQITERLQEISAEHAGAFGTGLDSIWDDLKNISVDALKSSLTLLVAIFGRLIDFIIVIFVTFYLLKDGDLIQSYLASLFPTADYERVMNLFDKILSALRTYICSQLVICCITGVVVFAYYTVRSLPYASVFATVSGIAEFVPVLGPTCASLFGVFLTATVDPVIALQTGIFYLILTQINHNIVYPTLIGKSLNLHPVAIILGVVLGGEVLGAAGMFLAVPFIVIVKLVIEDIYKDRVDARRRFLLSSCRRRQKKAKANLVEQDKQTQDKQTDDINVTQDNHDKNL